MSYAITTAAIQPMTGTALIDFANGPFAYLNELPDIRRAMQLSILNGMLKVFQAYTAHNQTLVNQIIAEIKILTSEQLAAGRPV